MFNTITGTSWGSIHLNEKGELAIIRTQGQQANKEEVTEILAQIGRRIEGAGWDPRIPNMKVRMYRTAVI